MVGEKLEESVGFTERVVPVHARRALRCDRRQSVVPSRWRTQNDVESDLEDMRAVTSDGDVIFW